eukprot:COSAG01_NODE_3185_length_6428_cov_3.036722_3_plen_90_part_00
MFLNHADRHFYAEWIRSAASTMWQLCADDDPVFSSRGRVSGPCYTAELFPHRHDRRECDVPVPIPVAVACAVLVTEMTQVPSPRRCQAQ